MKDLTEREAALSLVITHGLGPAAAGRLLDAFGSFRKAVQSILVDRVSGRLVSAPVAAALAEVAESRAWESERELMGKSGARFALRGDPDYPGVLSEIPDPPIGLYVKGSVLSTLTPMVGIVGSRRCTPRGRAIAADLAAGLTSAGVAVASGMARGVDTAAHEGALRAGGRTVAVLGCGLSRVYPPENARLARRIVASGSLVSEFPMRAEAKPGHFPRRNRTIAGLSAGVVVVEAAERSGALITAARALEQGREVFAVPGPIDAATSVGSNRLIKAGAALIEDAGDILDALKFAWGPFAPRTATPAGCDRAGASDGSLENRLLSRLSLEPSSIGSLIAATGAAAAEVLSELTGMELSGAVEKVEGHMYILGSRLRTGDTRRQEGRAADAKRQGRRITHGDDA